MEDAHKGLLTELAEWLHGLHGGSRGISRTIAVWCFRHPNGFLKTDAVVSIHERQPQLRLPADLTAFHRLWSFVDSSRSSEGVESDELCLFTNIGCEPVLGF